VQGEYVGKKGESFFDSLTFRSDGKVEVVLIGVRHEGSYEVDTYCKAESRLQQLRKAKRPVPRLRCTRHALAKDRSL